MFPVQPTSPPKQFRTEESIEHEEAFGQLAFAVATVNLPYIEQNIRNSPDIHAKIHTPYISLDTPRKRCVVVFPRSPNPIALTNYTIITVFELQLLIMQTINQHNCLACCGVKPI